MGNLAKNRITGLKFWFHYCYLVGARDKDRIDRERTMSVEAMVQAMIDDLTAALVDAAKHDKGNSAAGTRVRKAMQECKAAAQAVRVQVQNDKNN